jgi:hypothetical protein
MSIRSRYFPEYRLDLHVFSGCLNAEEMIRHKNGLDVTVRWLCYFDPTADLSGFDLAHMPELRRSVSAKEQRRAGRLPTVIVNASEPSESFLRFWRSYSAAAPEGAHRSVLFHSLEEACRYLDLPPAAHEALAAEVASLEAHRLERELSSAMAPGK